MRRIHLLLGALIAGAVALPVSRIWLTGTPPPPPATAAFDVKRRYWSERVKKDPSDVPAYVALGELEEREGYYLSARRRLLAARALGAPDSRVSPPLGRALSHLAREEEAQVELEKAARLFPDALEPALNLAGFFVDARQSGRARDLLRDWVRAHPDFADRDGLERLALALLSCGDETGADRMASKLVEIAPQDPGALSLAARCAFDAGDAPRAQRHLEALLPDAPDPAAAQYLYGLILQRQKKHDAALKAWQTANQLNPAAPDLYEKIGQEYARRGDWKRAAFALDRVASVDQGYPAAVRAARACEKAGRAADAAYWDAVAMGLRGEFAKALELSRAAARTSDPERRRRADTARAEALRGLKRTAEYVRTIEEITRAGTADDLLLRAYAYYQAETQQSLVQRLECLRQAAALAPERRAAISLQIAEQLRRTGRRDEAEKEMEAALAVAPDDPELVRTLGGFYLDRADRGERLAKATTLSEKAVRLTPDDEQAWLQLGQCHAARGDLARAAACLEHVVDLEPGFGPGYLELARVYARIGDRDGNKEMMRLYARYVAFQQKHETLQTRARSPKASIADIAAFADLLLGAGDFEGATAEYQRIMARTPKDPKVRRTLRQLYLRTGRHEQLLALEGDR